jgi:hypothetical protein
MSIEEMQEAEETLTFDVDESDDLSSAKSEDKPEQLLDVSNDSGASDDGASDDDLENYSGNVQKRINQLTAKRKQAIEEAQAAYQYAQQMAQENEHIKQQLSQQQQGYINEYGTRVESQHEQAKRLLKEARDIGDIDKEMEAQDLLARLAIERERVRVQKTRQEQVTEQPVQQAQQAAPQRAQAQPLDQKLVSWMEKNDSWFNKDMVMTSGAKAIHDTLVGAEGFDPTSDDYYAEIDKRMRKEFPHKFQSQRQNAQAVAPASSGRSVKSGRKKTVELSPGQVAFAKKMNIPLERYAREVAKLDSRSS